MEKTTLQGAYDLYFLPNIVRVIKSKRMRGAGHVERKDGRRVHTRFRLGKLK